MTHHDLRLILMLVLVIFGIQGFSAHMPPALLQGARVVQMLLSVAIVYLLVMSILSYTI